jgi:hypothetical protein
MVVQGVNRWTMMEVRFANFEDRVVVDVDDAVEIICDGLGGSVKLIEVILAIGDICGEGERGKVAYSGLVGGRAQWHA